MILLKMHLTFARRTIAASIFVGFFVLGLPPASSGQADNVSDLINQLKNSDSDGRENAAKALDGIDDPRAARPLIAALQDKDFYVRRFAAKALGDIKYHSAVEPLIAALSDFDWGVRLSAAEALGKIQDPRAIQPLRFALKDSDSDVRQGAADALGKLSFASGSSGGFSGNVPHATSTTSTASAPAAKMTVQAAQGRLLALGYQSGAADGVMGAKAIAALKKFQADHGLSATGQLDRKTLEALNAEEYRDLTKDDGLECHMYTTMISAMTSTNSNALNLGGRSFECRDVSGESRAIMLVAIQDLDNNKVAITTKDFGTIYYRNDETCVPYDAERAEEAENEAFKLYGNWHTQNQEGKLYFCIDKEMLEMTDAQIRKVKLFLGL